MAPTPPDAPEPAKPRLKTGLANAALLLAFPSCLCWLGAPVALALGIWALVLRRKHPTVYGGQSQASTAVFLSGWAIACLLIVGIPVPRPDGPPGFRPIWGGLDSRTKAVLRSGAYGNLRSMMSAEEAYRAANGGFYDAPACLVAPAKCLPNAPEGPMIDEALLRGAVQGYVFTFHAGPPASPEEIAAAKASPGSVKAYAITAIPADAGSGLTGLCADSSGRVCYLAGAQSPAIGSGRCPETCETQR